jgi:hypothetical protein
MNSQLEMFTTGATRFAVGVAKSEPRKQHVHENSVKTYYESRAKLSERADEVFAVYVGEGCKLTDREVLNALNYTDMNAVRPRITELIDLGLIRECGRVKDTITGRHVRVCEVVR